MKKLKFVLMILCICMGSAFAFADNSVQSPMSLYNDNYFIAGNYNQQGKIQLSAKYNLFWPFDSGIYLGYTQLSHYIFYKESDTFYTMYQPEIYYRFTSGSNPFNNFIIPGIDFFQASPYYHCSTGVEGADHRMIQYYYWEVQSSIGTQYNVGANIRVFNYYSINDRNSDINKYKKNYLADIFFKINSEKVANLSNYELHCKFEGNPLGYGYVEGELAFKLMTAKIQPRLFIQIFHGYDEFMVNYNVKETSYRAGISFNE